MSSPFKAEDSTGFENFSTSLDSGGAALPFIDPAAQRWLEFRRGGNRPIHWAGLRHAQREAWKKDNLRIKDPPQVPILFRRLSQKRVVYVSASGGVCVSTGWCMRQRTVVCVSVTGDLCVSEGITGWRIRQRATSATSNGRQTRKDRSSALPIISMRYSSNWPPQASIAFLRSRLKYFCSARDWKRCASSTREIV